MKQCPKVISVDDNFPGVYDKIKLIFIEGSQDLAKEEKIKKITSLVK